jgi:transposase
VSVRTGGGHQRRRHLVDAAAAEADVKKKSLSAAEQSRPDVQEARANFFAEQLKDVPLANVVVLDESYATTTFTRPRGRCPVDQRLKQHVPAGHWKRLTILAAITVAGVLCAASIDAATDADVFRGFVSGCLVPALRPGMVVVMDNLSSHKVAGVREAVEAAGCRVVYLPPYSPDLSPIENIWSKAKSLMRLLEARSAEDLEAAVTLALEAVSAEDCRNCFQACGYSLHLK